MKKLLSLSVLASALVLTACGGGSSDSSGSTTTTTTTTTTPTTTTPTTTPSTTSNACEISGTNVYGKNGTTCTFNIPSYNNGATGNFVCNTNGYGEIVEGSSRISANGITLGTYKFACK